MHQLKSLMILVFIPKKNKSNTSQNISNQNLPKKQKNTQQQRQQTIPILKIQLLRVRVNSLCFFQEAHTLKTRALTLLQRLITKLVKQGLPVKLSSKGSFIKFLKRTASKGLLFKTLTRQVFSRANSKLVLALASGQLLQQTRSMHLEIALNRQNLLKSSKRCKR